MVAILASCNHDRIHHVKQIIISDSHASITPSNYF